MKEVLRINLDNEMDLILAHKRTMKLAELCGLMVSAQTRFATAVSEIARCSIAYGQDSYLLLGISFLNGGKKEILAVIYDRVDLFKSNNEALAYAERLSKEISQVFEQDIYKITLSAKVPFSGILSEGRIASFVKFFKNERPLSPYDEIRKKNIQLIEFADKLSESESKYRQLTDTLPMIVFSVSRSGQVSVTNKSAETIFGSQFKEFTPAVIAGFIYKDDAEAVIKTWDNAKKRHAANAIQARINLQNQPIWYQISMVPNKDEKDDVTGWTISMVNIHAQKLVEETLKDNQELHAAQEKLKEYNDELQKKNNELEQFAYIASHDLQEPLRKIRNFISLSQHNREDSEKQDYYYSRINAAAERMSQLIKDVLGYSKLSIKSEQFEPVNLNGVISEVLDDFEFLIREKNAVINADGLPTVNGSQVQLGQLFYNLISNSLKFSENAPLITISYELIRTEKAFHKITISDNGIGIEPQHLDKIFTIFKRLHPQNVYPGTGIGLALCRKIVENHLGAIEIASQWGAGTQTCIYLPI